MDYHNSNPFNIVFTFKSLILAFLKLKTNRTGFMVDNKSPLFLWENEFNHIDFQS